jgi:cardiolipin synthase
LKEKAKEGVIVRVIYDDVGCFLILPSNYPEILETMGIECVVFNKFRPLWTTVQNNRDHRKIAIIDGKVAFTGGINFSDEYINTYERFGHWKDAGMKITGKAAWSFTLIFLQMWSICKRRKENYLEFYPFSDNKCNNKSDGFIQPYADSPMDKENIGEHVYLHIINKAKRYLYINTPYLIIDDSMVSALKLAAKSGVDVRITVPYRWDKRLIHFTTRSYYRDLIKSGVKIYEYSKGFIHSKSFISDDEIATIGTINLDFRSLYLHFECGMCIYDAKCIEDMKKDFVKTLDVCKEITLNECSGNIITRFLQDICKLFAPLM